MNSAAGKVFRAAITASPVSISRDWETPMMKNNVLVHPQNAGLCGGAMISMRVNQIRLRRLPKLPENFFHSFALRACCRHESDADRIS
jgi:hypothetical protein